MCSFTYTSLGGSALKSSLNKDLRLPVITGSCAIMSSPVFSLVQQHLLLLHKAGSGFTNLFLITSLQCRVMVTRPREFSSWFHTDVNIRHITQYCIKHLWLVSIT